MKLYEITEQHKNLLKLADESEDMAIAVADTMESIEGDFDDKSISLIHVVHNMDADVVAIDIEINRLTARKKSITKKQNSMIEYLRINMEASDISKISCPLFTITLAKGRDIVQIDDESKIPTDYINMTMVEKPMKKEILSALKNGEIIEGCSMVKSSTSVRIK